MKSIVFDNAGTILKRISVLNDVVNNKLIYESNTIGIANKKSSRIIIVLQTPAEKLAMMNGKIYDYLKKYPHNFEISYSQTSITKNEVLNAIKRDTTSFEDLSLTTNTLTKKYDVEIISGCALIVDMYEKQIDYVYTAGGLFFEDTRKVINFINNSPLSVYIASGDNKESLNKIASTLEIPQTNVFSTLNKTGKYNLIQSLQEKGNYVYMVGNHTNDQLAIEQADVGILTLEQEETVPNTLQNSADYIIHSLGDVIEIIKKDNEV